MDSTLEMPPATKDTRMGSAVKPPQIFKDVRTRLIGALCALGMSGWAIAAPNASSAPTHPAPTVSFSAVPTEMEFRSSGLFAEPLAPVGPTTTEENQDLAATLRAYQELRSVPGASSDEVEGLVAFIKAHPHSAWNPALELNLGLIDRQTGHFSQALAIWQQGWEESKGLSGEVGVLMANAMVAELSQFEAYLGRKELLEPLMASLAGRSIGGTARQMIGDSGVGLYDMIHSPEESFRCGPLALKRILNYGGAELSPVAERVLDFESPSTDHGISLSTVKDIAERAGMHYQMAYRTAGAPVLIPAVANWKVGHYAAIVDRDSQGRYLIEDSTFGEDILMSASTLDEESSGYFLVPEGALPEGWRPVSTEEGGRVWGRGNTGRNIDPNNTGTSVETQASTQAGSGPADPAESTTGTAIAQTSATNTACMSPTGCVTGMTTSAVELAVVGLQLNDTPVGYTPPVGSAIKFSLTYSHRDAQQPPGGIWTYTSVGPNWTFNWLSYIQLTGKATSNGTLVTWYKRGGGSEPFNFKPNATTATTGGPYSHTILTQTANGYTLSFPDGSYEQFDQPSGTTTPINYYMTAVSDPHGNVVTLAYDSSMRIASITDAIGQISTLTYGASANAGSNYNYLVTQITDPFGRYATFNYYTTANAPLPQLVGSLQSITDVLGITSSYLYGEANVGGGNDTSFINALTTPYGTTNFVYGDYRTNASLGSARFLKTTDPLTRTSYVEFNQAQVPGDATLVTGSKIGATVPTALVPQGMSTCNQYIETRNTFVFDANQYFNAKGPGGLNYAKGRVIHWLHLPGDSNPTSSSQVKESEKEPLENRVWYNYPGQSGQPPCNGAQNFPLTASYAVTTGANNNPTFIGRVLDDGSTELQQFTYNTQGNVLTYIDPIGRAWSYIYDSSGGAFSGINLLQKINTTGGTSQLLETRAYFPGTTLVSSITGANGKSVSMLYNAFGEMTQFTDQLTHITKLKYNTSGYLNSVQGPITGALTSYSYDTFGRVLSMTDPAGGKFKYFYDNADRLTSTLFPDGTTTVLNYTNPSYPLDLSSSIDRMQQQTNYIFDADRELMEVTDPNNDSTSYGYNAAGVLYSIKDPRGHSTSYTLDDQSRLTVKTYADTSLMSIQYLQAKSLPYIVTDVLQQTKTYAYYPDNLVKSITYTATQPTANVTYTYDPAFPRIATMIDGTGTTTYSYYPILVPAALNMNQLETVSSPVAGSSITDSVTYSYDELSRVTGRTITSPVGSFTSNQTTGYDALGRVNSVTNPLDTFTYGYQDGTARVYSITSTAGPAAAMAYYPPTSTLGSELLNTLTYTNQGASSPFSQFTYVYNSDNLVTSLSVTSPVAQTTSYLYDPANRLKTGQIGSTTPYAYLYDPASNLTSITTNGTTTTHTYNNLNEVNGATYDANGSPTAIDNATLLWDGENRVVQYTSGNAVSTLTYDGVGRLVRMVNSKSGTVTVDYSYFWCGSTRCLIHSNLNAGAIEDQYFDQGQILFGNSYYYVRDQLGSVMQIITNTGTSAGQYTYDPYGNRTVVSGLTAFDGGYAGLWLHTLSGLEFAQHRAYDPVKSRWLNRDPIGEAGGANLYAYASGSPTTFTDPSGFDTYITNRFLAIWSPMPDAVPRWDFVSHTFTFSTNPNGSIAHTYSWGNTANPTGWNLDQPEDIAAAQEALAWGYAAKIGEAYMDPYYNQAFNMLYNVEPTHRNGVVTNNCKTEATNLSNLATALYLNSSNGSQSL